MITAVFAQKGEDIATVIRQQLGIMSEEHTRILAEEHKKELDKAIDATRERVLKSTGNHLKDAIEVEQLNEAGKTGYGVGNIDVLNQKTPWWVWINFGRALSGRTVPPSTKEVPSLGGHFEPDTKGIFTRGQPKFPIFPKKAIQAHNYIEKALGVMIGKARSLLKF
jgi:hypothetical protein